MVQLKSDTKFLAVAPRRSLIHARWSDASATIAIAIFCVCVCMPFAKARAQDEIAKATTAAIEFASKSVVQIDTIGGLTPAGQSRSTAPFSGTIVSADGLIVTASYNLLHQPASVFVKLPGEDDVVRVAAKVVSTDSSRNLTLLKIDRNELVPIRFADPVKIQIGQRAIAVGKSMSISDANVSFGIVSAKGRIWNRATQTDAKISRQNYGAPLVTLAGEAVGILVPMSHSSTEVAAGADWYDSGIGFAANVDPNSDSFKRFLAGESLRAGLMGLKFEGPDENADSAKISFCLPTSPAGKAGLKVGDTITKAAGQDVVRQGQLKHIVGPLYENERLAVVVDRDGKTLEFEIELAGEIDPYVEPEIGILLALTGELPVIDAILPQSPAADAELEPGDQITRVNDTSVANSDELRKALSQLVVGDSCRLFVERNDESVEVTLKTRRQLANTFTKTPGRSPGQQRSFESIEIAVAEGSNKCIAFVPKSEEGKETDRPNPAVLVWVPAPGPVDQKTVFKRFEQFCTDSDTIVLVPQSVDPKQWLPDDASVISKAVERLGQRVKIDSNRVAIAGKGSGGLMALRTAFAHRSTFRGVVTIDSELSTTLPNLESQPSLRMHMLVLGGKDVEESINFFREKGFAIFSANQGSGARLKQVFSWLSVLDRL